MLGAHAVGLGFLCHVIGCFLLVTFDAQKLEIALAMLAAINQRDDMIQLPGAANLALAFAGTNAVASIEDTDADAGRHRLVIGPANPFG